APADRNVDTPDSDALGDQPGDGNGHEHQQTESQSESGEPADGNRPGQYDGRDLVGNRFVAVPGLDDARQAADFSRVRGAVLSAHPGSPCSLAGGARSGCGLRTAPR